MKTVVSMGGFDNVRVQNVRFMEQASKMGELTILLWKDDLVESVTGQKPKLPLEERKYFLESIRFISNVIVMDKIIGISEISDYIRKKIDYYVDSEKDESPEKFKECKNNTIEYHVLSDAYIKNNTNNNTDFYLHTPGDFPDSHTKKKVIVTGCYDWFHTGHIAFFEEASSYGDLIVIVGHDENIRLLKGDGHPMFSEVDRCYFVHSIRYVKHAFISSGNGWLDADPEIKIIQPDIYIVNEDGDVPEKREYCEKNEIEYIVLKRVPKSGLTPRTSTNLRGF